ncbi:hypothetical protein [Patulibacter defluvii]|uniref:hypothetical protein n=1 Tax=Patulibacter defluvii TaxID=3095358 RepID=UPI002A74F31D|nr:hypothetical protein [Patulibacter sp. DM4]
MASDAASATATVVRATAAQVRLRLSDDREVTKRVTVPAEIRDALEGATVPVTVTGTGARAKVELADGWLDGIGGGAAPKAKRTRSGAPKAAAKTTAKDADGKPVRKRTRGTAAAATAAKADAPAKAEAAPKAKSTRAKSAAKPAAKGATAKAATAKSSAKADDAKPAAKRTRKPAAAKAKAEAPAAPAAAKAEKVAEAPKAEAPKAKAEPAAAPRQDAPAAKSSRSRRRRNVPAIPKVDPELIRTQIAGAVDLVRKARKLTRR